MTLTVGTLEEIIKLRDDMLAQPASPPPTPVEVRVSVWADYDSSEFLFVDSEAISGVYCAGPDELRSLARLIGLALCRPVEMKLDGAAREICEEHDRMRAYRASHPCLNCGCLEPCEHGIDRPVR